MKRRGPQRWQPRGGAIVAPDPRAMLAIAAPPRARAGLAVALPLSLALHLAGVAYLSLRDPAPAPVTIAPIEVALLREAAPGPIEAPPAPEPPRVVPPPPAPKPVAKKPVAKPTPPRVEAVANPPPIAAPAPAAPAADAAVAAPGATGEAAPAAVSAAPPSSVGRGGGGDPLKSYVASVLRQIEAKKRYPSLAKSRGIEGTVVVTLWISPAGQLDRLEVGGEAPPLLVSSTRDAVERASPFPPPPAGMPSIRVPIRYALR